MGPKVPQDVLNYGQTAEVKATLIYYDNEVLELLQNRLASGTAGTMPNVNGETLAIGALMGQCNWMNKLYVLRGNSCTDTGSTAEGGWCFGAAYLSGPDSFTVGTKVTEHEITFRCLPDASGVLFSKYLPS